MKTLGKVKDLTENQSSFRLELYRLKDGWMDGQSSWLTGFMSKSSTEKGKRRNYDDVDYTTAKQQTEIKVMLLFLTVVRSVRPFVYSFAQLLRVHQVFTLFVIM